MARIMKDSGVEWIGKVPSYWEITKLKYISYNHYSGGTPSASNESFYSTKGESFVNISDITKQEYLQHTEKKITELGAKDKNLKLVPSGSFIYAMYASIGKFSISMKDMYISQALLSFKEKSSINKKFLSYYLRFLEDYVYTFSFGTTQINLNAEIVKNFIILLPDSLEEQEAIVSFLDEKSSKIDEIIENTKKSIDKYNSYKQSLITETVTKGLDLNVKMKDSGIEWIGEIPEHWDRTRLKRVLEIPITDGPHETPELLDDGIPFISAEAIKNNTIDFNLKRGYISLEDHIKYSQKCKPEINDIFMIKSGATTGNVALVNTEKEFSIWSPLALIRSNSKISFYKYLFYFIQSKTFQLQVEQFWNYGTQQNIGMGILGNLYVSIPPILQQKEIAYYLDQKTEQIDSIIKNKEKLIEKLESYKKSLIFEYVTGKKEVI